MKIAIPIANGRLNAHFGGSTQFALVDADPTTKTITATQTVTAPPHAPGLFPRWLHSLGVQAIIAGGIGQRALDLFAQQGIEVRAGQPDRSVEELVAAYLNGTLQGTPTGCTHHEHHHGDHEHHA
jgi:predicted Fe-Mo cluster-binding NifX family protein